ncbi:MAG: 50S ribosomal protein L25 [Patescibacteria group bacterium]
MINQILNVKIKENLNKRNDELRAEGWIPAVVYGHDFDNKSLAIKYADFEKIYRVVGESSLFDLSIEGENPVKVIIADIQKDSVSEKIIHIDFRKVHMNEKIKTEVEFEFINESPAVKNLGGILVKALDKLEISCLPGDLIQNIKVDLSKLSEIGSVIRVKDFKFPASVEVLAENEAAVVLVEAPKAEEKPTQSASEPTKAEETKESKKDDKQSGEGDNSAESK